MEVRWHNRDWITVNRESWTTNVYFNVALCRVVNTSKKYIHWHVCMWMQYYFRITVCTVSPLRAANPNRLTRWPATSDEATRRIGLEARSKKQEEQRSHCIYSFSHLHPSPFSPWLTTPISLLFFSSSGSLVIHFPPRFCNHVSK